MKILSLVHAHSFLFEKTEIFGPVWPNVSVKNDHPKRIFSKTISRNEVSENAFLMLWMDEFIFFYLLRHGFRYQQMRMLSLKMILFQSISVPRATRLNF